MCYARFLLLLLFNFVALHAHERITSFVSNIVVNIDATIHVEETIDVISEHKDIMHGIVREFPTTYRDAQGIYYVVDFSIQLITHNGYEVPFRIESVSNGKKIYIGDAQSVIARGKHSYVITYTANRQLGFFKDHDEIYWNVTGTGWRLPIDKVEARIQLPKAISQGLITAQAYTGYQDEKGNNYVYTIKDNYVTFSTKHAFKPFEGITIVATFPKGFVIEPSWWQKVYWFFRDNIFIIWILLALLLLVCTIIWGVFAARRINKSGVIIPLFYPPVSMMPSDVGFMSNMYFDAILLPADIIDLAVHGFITIKHEPGFLYGDTYTLIMKNPLGSLHQDVATYHKTLLKILFEKSETLNISESNHHKIQKALEECRKHVYRECGSYITTLTTYWYLSSFFFFLLACGIFFFFSNFAIEGLFIPILMMIFCISLLKRLFVVYTPAGKHMQNAIDGFKMYLMTAEIDRMHVVGTPPIKTPELYEKYLPYAVALGVEKQWTEQFAAVFERLLKQDGYVYYPTWYSGNSFRMSNFQSSFSTSISSASTRPGSSSGSGGKGRSGGGGGGGGGGGW